MSKFGARELCVRRRLAALGGGPFGYDPDPHERGLAFEASAAAPMGPKTPKWTAPTPTG